MKKLYREIWGFRKGVVIRKEYRGKKRI